MHKTFIEEVTFFVPCANFISQVPPPPFTLWPQFFSQCSKAATLMAYVKMEEDWLLAYVVLSCRPRSFLNLWLVLTKGAPCPFCHFLDRSTVRKYTKCSSMPYLHQACTIQKGNTVVATSSVTVEWTWCLQGSFRMLGIKFPGFPGLFQFSLTFSWPERTLRLSLASLPVAGISPSNSRPLLWELVTDRLLVDDVLWHTSGWRRTLTYQWLNRHG